MKKYMIAILLTLTILLTSCSETTPIEENLVDIIDTTDTSEDYSDSDITQELDNILLEINEDTINLDKYYDNYLTDVYTELSSDFSEYTITTAGVYVLSGTYTSTVTINVLDDEDVTLILDNVTISVYDGPAILVLNAEDVTITSLPGTDNLVEDFLLHTLVDTEDYNSAIYSTSDLVFNGSGTLTVNGNYNNAINTKDDLKIVETNLIVTSVDDGIIGKDYIAISNATITVDVEGDALSSTNDEATDKGFIYIESGTLNLTSGADAIEAVNDVLIYGGTFVINSVDSGIESDTSIYIGGGDITINSDNDALNSSNSITIYDGNITITAGDDGIHADTSITIEGGTINILSSYEGIEAFEITINGGTINVTATDDGINATVGGGQEHGQGYVSTGGYLNITGGIIQVNADADGVDVNGSGTVSGGYLIVFGSSLDSQSSIDYDDTFTVTGGLIVAVGSTGMIQSFSSTSTQASLMYADTTSYQSGTSISLIDEDNNVIVAIDALKAFSGVVISSDQMVDGSSYTFQVGSETYDFTISSNVTSLGDGGTTQGEIGGGLPPRR